MHPVRLGRMPDNAPRRIWITEVQRRSLAAVIPARSTIEPGQKSRRRRTMLARHGAQILATAGRYAGTLEDADDAY